MSLVITVPCKDVLHVINILSSFLPYPTLMAVDIGKVFILNTKSQSLVISVPCRNVLHVIQILLSFLPYPTLMAVYIEFEYLFGIPKASLLS